MSVSSTLLAVFLWPFRQLRGFLANVRAGVGSVQWSDVVAPWFIARYRELKAFYGRQVAWVLGDGSPTEMIVASVVLAVSLVVASATLLTYLAVVFVVPLSIGLLRYWPWVNGVWTAYWPLYGSLSWGGQ